MRLQEYLEVEKRHGAAIYLERVVDWASAALGLNRNLICSISTAEDVSKFPDFGEQETRDRSVAVPMELAEVVRKTVGLMFLE